MEKGFTNLACREFYRWHCDGGSRVEKRLGFFVIQIGVGSRDLC